MGTYVFRWPYPANHVYVSGTFDDWGKTEELERVGDHWEKEVRLPDADHEVMYKFVVDDKWILDDNEPQRDDGHYNINNVLAPSKIKRLGHRVIAISRGRPGSLSSDSPTHAATVSAGGEGAPLLTLEQSEANLNRWIPHVPANPRRSVTRRLTLSEQKELGGLATAPTVSAGGMGAPLLSKEHSEMNLARKIPDVTPDPDRPVTRAIAQTDGATASKEEIAEIDQSVPGAFPETPAVEKDNFKADPLPLTGQEDNQSAIADSNEGAQKLGGATLAGIAGAGLVGAGVAGAIAHEKKSDDVSIQPIPATGHQDLQSSVTTSKEDYEKLGGVGTATAPATAIGTGPDEVSVKPIPATGHSDLQSSVTTSKEDYENLGSLGTAKTDKVAETTPGEVSAVPIPATGHSDLQSSVTTSKEDYENLGSLGTAKTDKVAETTPGEVSAVPIPATGHSDLQSSVTTSKEDYENLGSVGTAKTDTITGTTPAEVSVAPIPATGHSDTKSSVTTSKEDYEKSGGEGTAAGEYGDKPIPATGHDNTQSSVTTSKEDYEKLGALGVAGVAVAGVGAATASALSKPKETDKNIIPESSLPMNPEKTDTLDAGPFVTSSGPGTTTADLASKVPLEPKREAKVVDDIEAPVPSKEAGATPFVSSVGPVATTAGLASQVPLEPKKDATVVEPSAPSAAKDTGVTPFVSSVGPGATTSSLASQVPLEPKKEPEVVDTSKATTGATPFVSSVGAGATTAALASQVPLEKDLSPEIKQEKSALEKELLSKIPESEAKGEPASAAKAQTSYYGLATTVPPQVQESLQKAHASPEAATESSVVAEKSMMERELQDKVPVVESAGEPAPTISAATASTAPTTTAGVATAAGVTGAGVAAANKTVHDATALSAPDTASTTAAALTDGKTANETVPGTDTSTATTAHPAGEIAGGAIVGGAAAAGAAALATRHEDKDAEPPLVTDAQKPATTTEAVPATSAKSPISAGSMGQASPHPGVAPSAAAALSDGTEDPTIADEPAAPKITAPVEKSEAEATEYAPPRAQGIVPGASPMAAAALSDGTEDPTLSEEPAVKMMAQNEAQEQAATTSTTEPAKTAEAPVAAKERKSVDSADIGPMDTRKTEAEKVGGAAVAAAGVGAGAAAIAGKAKETPAEPSKKIVTTPAGIPWTDSPTNAATPPATPKKTIGTGVASSSSTPAKSTTTSTAGTPTEEGRRKKRHRLSAIIKKIFD